MEKKHYTVLYRKLSRQAGFIAFPAIFLASIIGNYLLFKVGYCCFRSFFFDHIWQIEAVWVSLVVCVALVSYRYNRKNPEFLAQVTKDYIEKLQKSLKRVIGPDTPLYCQQYRDRLLHRIRLLENFYEVVAQKE